jgi:hypothetical protein
MGDQIMKHPKAAAAAVSLAVISALPVAAGGAASASQFQACQARQLHITVKLTRAAMGNAGLTLTATNDGPACVLSGFPQVRLETPRGAILPARVKDVRTDFFGRGSRPGSLLVLYKLSATAELDLSTASGPGAAVQYVQVQAAGGHDRAKVPAGPAFINAQATVTAWAQPKNQAKG